MLEGKDLDENPAIIIAMELSNVHSSIITGEILSYAYRSITCNLTRINPIYSPKIFCNPFVTKNFFI